LLDAIDAAFAYIVTLKINHTSFYNFILKVLL